MKTEEDGGALKNAAAPRPTATKAAADDSALVGNAGAATMPTAAASPDLAGWAHCYARAGYRVLPLHTPSWPPECQCSPETFPWHEPTCAQQVRCSCMAADCSSIGKHPRTLHGKDDATTDAEQITRWWSMWPDANIGLVPPAGIVVLDIDFDRTPDEDEEPDLPGLDEVGKLLHKTGRPLSQSETRMCWTGGNGLHIWLSYAGPHAGCLRDEQGVALPQVDVKGPSGYLVSPPSIHATGQHYYWTEGSTAVAEAPPTERVRQMLRPPARPRRTRGSASPETLAAWVSRAERGNRNSALYWACCRAQEQQLDMNPLVDAAVRCGLARSEAEATAASAARAPTKAQRAV